MDSDAITAGVDVGSLYTKTVIMKDNQILSFNCMKSGVHYKGAAEVSMTDALNKASLKFEDIKYIVATGYGRSRTAFANKEITEITCHGKGAGWLFPEVHTVIDIGGQDSKVIWIEDGGIVTNFVMNDKCAAGTGRFLEVMAGALEVGLEKMGELSLQSRRRLEVSSVCTVFAETEVISLLSEGRTVVDILAGIHRAIARRIGGMVGQHGVKERVVLQGGVAKNIGVLRALEERLGIKIIIPQEPQIVGALGAAIKAQELLRS